MKHDSYDVYLLCMPYLKDVLNNIDKSKLFDHRRLSSDNKEVN